jgi:hypothetical protein
MDNKVAGLTAGGVSETIASDSQMTPLRSKRTLKLIEKITEPPPHLSPEDGGQTKHATAISAQEEQANKHD